MEINGIIHHKFFSSDKLGFEKTIFEVNGELLSEYKGWFIIYLQIKINIPKESIFQVDFQHGRPQNLLKKH